MKKLLLLTTCIISIQVVFAQVSLRICNNVDKNGNTYSAKCIFDIRDGDELFMLVDAEKNFNTSRLDYKVYKVNGYGETSYDATISQDVQSSWEWAYKGVLFHSSGYYLVKVYKADGSYLTEAMVYINWRG